MKKDKEDIKQYQSRRRALKFFNSEKFYTFNNIVVASSDNLFFRNNYLILYFYGILNLFNYSGKNYFLSK